LVAEEPSARLELAPSGPFSLAAAASFGFGPTEGRAGRFDGVLRYAFALDRGSGYAGVELRQADDDAPVTGEVHGGGDPPAVARQLARVLSLDHDGEAFLEVGQRDPVIGRLQREFPGQRPVLFFSPYEAAAWSVISARQRGIPAAQVRATISERWGECFNLSGRQEWAFPQPDRLLDAGELSVPGLNEEKERRLLGIAEAARAGLLEVAALQSLGPQDAFVELQRLRGIGPFYASLIVVRACGFADAPLPVAEPKVLANATRFYGLAEPLTLERFTELAEAWRPFRTWATVLVRLAGDRGAAA
jgi:DNA-3-methyladenine glycosylase II